MAIPNKKSVHTFSEIIANQVDRPVEVLADWRNFIAAFQNNEVTKASKIMSAHVFRFGKILAVSKT